MYYEVSACKMGIWINLLKERKKLIRKKLELQGLTEGSGVREEDQSSYDKEEMIDLILLTRCFQKNKFQ